MTSRKNWLNSTGSCRRVEDEYFSYNQQMTAHYKGYRLFDTGFWSMTTRKHQGIIRYYIGRNTIDLNYADFNKGVEYSINSEIRNLEYELEKRQNKRKTQKNLDEMDNIKFKIANLQSILDEDFNI